ncbi:MULTISPECIES: hypothetical protein [unclassified Ruegeria]|uniref:hypothetical protein n=1 Tax=unclassified Ruegeria TaxID=2625375 RepID=UPI001490E377|nr:MULTISPECIES: hypothetical protein [unclassified Ruegeria]NOE33309.1 hypothetical protein [Ruegeria sp. HKCCD7318]
MTSQIALHLKNRQLGLYANSLFVEIEKARKTANYQAVLTGSARHLFISLNGPNNVALSNGKPFDATEAAFQPRRSMLPPGVVNLFAKSANSIGLKREQLRAEFLLGADVEQVVLKDYDLIYSSSDAWEKAKDAIFSVFEKGSRFRRVSR